MNASAACACAALSSFAQSASAQPYPSKPLRLIVDFAAGSGVTAARTLSQPVASYDAATGTVSYRSKMHPGLKRNLFLFATLCRVESGRIRQYVPAPDFLERTTFMQTFPGFLFLTIIAAWSAVAQAQPFPSRPVRIVVPFTPGGSNDIIARALGQKLTNLWGQSVVIDNRGGAGGTIGSDLAAKSQPDGYTLLMGATSTIAANVNLYPKLPFDPVRDLAPISQIATGAFVLAINSSVPATSVKELIALARAKPGQLNFGSSGNGTSVHLAAELFRYMAKIDIVHVPYKGLGPALIDLLAGQIAIQFTDMAPIGQHVKSGKLRALGQTSLKRTAPLPDLPTLDEAGVPGYSAESWYGLLAPSATPKPIIARLNADVINVLRTPDLKERLFGLGIEPVGNSPEQFAQYIRQEIAKWGEIVKVSGTKLD